jgi:ubiquitin-like 1-activating enzyme E1 B
VFGNTAESMLYEATVGSEASVYMGKVAFPPVEQRTDDIIISHMSTLITAMFHSELIKQIEMKIYKTSATTPIPLDLSVIEEGCAIARAVLQGKAVRLSAQKGWERHTWTDAECVAELIACAHEVLNSREGCEMLGSYVFDKDNRFTMCFVTAASNLRSRIFHIAPMTYHDAKGVAGNIIPAIASTNAIIAGLQVAQAIRMLTLCAQGTPLTKEHCLTTYCQRMPTRRGYYLQPSQPDPSNEGCYVCNSSQQRLEVCHAVLK